jgi:hypothetical protein
MANAMKTLFNATQNLVLTLTHKYENKNIKYLIKLDNVWENIVGQNTASFTKVEKITNDTLFVKLTIPHVKHMVNYNKNTIIQAVNTHFGENLIQEIILR